MGYVVTGADSTGAFTCPPELRETFTAAMEAARSAMASIYGEMIESIGPEDTILGPLDG